MKKKLCAVLLLAALTGIAGPALAHRPPAAPSAVQSDSMTIFIDLEHGSW